MTLDFNQLFPTINPINASGTIRQIASDFKVTELNHIELSGSGEHLWLWVQKKDCNTDWVANKLSNVCQVPRRQVGFAGLKDRHAITQQWFSIQLSKVTDVAKINAALPDEVTVLDSNIHSKKIKIGQLDANQFEIIIRDVTGGKTLIEQNIASVLKNGAPNYFGPQRFGHHMGNIQKAQDWFSGQYKVKSRNLKSLLISTARSHIFNCIVAKRIKSKTWNNPIDGDILQLNKSHSWFPLSDATNEEVKQRLEQFDIHITAAMCGEDTVQSTGECAFLETTILNQFPIYQQGFEKFRLKQDRRAMRICPMDFSYAWEDNHLIIKFKLLPGAYATGVMRELLFIT